MYRVLTSNVVRHNEQLVEMAVAQGEQIKSLSVQNTTLDDVSYITRGVSFVMNRSRLRLRHAQRPGVQAMIRMMAIVEREMRKFFRSPALMMVSMAMRGELLFWATPWAQDSEPRTWVCGLRSWLAGTQNS